MTKGIYTKFGKDLGLTNKQEHSSLDSGLESFFFGQPTI